jgi:putative hydrolase of the HAD superfamily
MLARIPRSYRRAILSNTNALHWPRVLNDMQLGAAFDCHFVSHITGRIKPDPDAFEHAVESLDCIPKQVLFLDDNMLNVRAAQSYGMHAIRVRGAIEAQHALAELGILGPPADG